MITDTIKDHLKNLDIDPAEAIVVGGSVLAVLGIRAQGDIDIMISESTFHRIASDGYAVSRFPDGSGQITIDDTELMYSWQGKTNEDFLPNAIHIDGVSFMSLEEVRAWKQQQNRPKDQHDIQLIDAYLAVRGQQ